MYGVSCMDMAMSFRPSGLDLLKNYEETMLQSLITTFGLDYLRECHLSNDDVEPPISNEAYERVMDEVMAEEPQESYVESIVTGIQDKFTNMATFILPKKNLVNFSNQVKRKIEKAKETIKEVEMEEFSLDDIVQDSILNNMETTYNNYQGSLKNQVHLSHLTDHKYWVGAGKNVLNKGIQMALRQGVGFFLAEIWFGIREKCFNEWSTVKSIKEFSRKMEQGIKFGFTNAKSNFPVFWKYVKEEALEGTWFNIVVMLINSFRHSIRVILQALFQMRKVVMEKSKVIFSKEDIPLADRTDAILKCFIVSSSVVFGSLIITSLGSIVAELPVGDALTEFLGALIAGMMMTTGFFLLERYNVAERIEEFFESSEVAELRELTTEYKRLTDSIEALVEPLTKCDWGRCKAGYVDYDCSCLEYNHEDYRENLDSQLQATCQISDSLGVAEEQQVKSTHDVDDFMS